MNTSTNLKLAALALCLFVSFANAAASHAQSKSKEKSDATTAQGAGTPSDVVRAYYTALREGRVRDAMLMSVLRPAVEELSAADLAEYQPDFERIKQLAPTDFEITGEQISGDEATVFVKTGEEGKDLKVEPVNLIRDHGVWIVGDRANAAEVKKQGKKFFPEQRIAAHEEDAEDMLKRVQAAEIAYALQHGGIYGDLKSLVDAGFMPADILGSETTGYQFTVATPADRKSYTAHAEPARYNHTGRLSFYMDAGGIQKKDAGGKPVGPSASKK
ncbi:MAG TPA: hypothetical protein VLJ61_07630 [Pyrinomonadaceae bacterium]|nr:hypothetical protein [Pyrinomonadaceae bacterium]